MKRNRIPGRAVPYAVPNPEAQRIIAGRTVLRYAAEFGSEAHG